MWRTKRSICFCFCVGEVMKECFCIGDVLFRCKCCFRGRRQRNDRYKCFFVNGTLLNKVLFCRVFACVIIVTRPIGDSITPRLSDNKRTK